MNDLVKPQPGQSTPKIRLLEQVSGIGILNPGKKTDFSPSDRIRIDINKMAAAIKKKIVCNVISLLMNSGGKAPIDRASDETPASCTGAESARSSLDELLESVLKKSASVSVRGKS